MTAPRNAVQTQHGRMYRWGTESFPSVTSIISAGVPKNALPYWAAKSAAEFVADNLDEVVAVATKDRGAAIDLIKGSPWRKRDKAADVGTALHEAAESYALGRPSVAPAPEVAPLVDAFLRWVDSVEPVFEAAEFSVFSRSKGYAGTADAIVQIHGVKWLIDYKSSPTGPFPDVCLQLAALRHADFVGMPDGSELPVPAVDRCGVLKVRPEGCTLYPVQAGETELRFFQYAAEVARFGWEHSKSVIGAPEPERTKETV